MPRPRVLCRKELKPDSPHAKAAPDPPVRPHMTASTLAMFQELAQSYFGSGAGRKVHESMRRAAADARGLLKLKAEIGPALQQLAKCMTKPGEERVTADAALRLVV